MAKMPKLKVKKLHSQAIIPDYQTDGASGFDLCALEDGVIEVGKWALVPTGLAFEVKSGYEVQVRSRSGLALNYGITVLNSPGTVDSDYRGEIKVILINLGQQDYQVKKGERIAQGVVCKVKRAIIEEHKKLSKTKRAKGGFGSTGKH